MIFNYLNFKQKVRQFWFEKLLFCFVLSLVFTMNANASVLNDGPFKVRTSIDAAVIQCEDYDLKAYYSVSPVKINAGGYRDNGDSIGVNTVGTDVVINTEASKDNWAEYSVGSIDSAKYKITIRYANGFNAFTVSQFNAIGGTKVAEKKWWPTTSGGWDKWAETVDTILLVKGNQQVIRLGFMNYALIDWIKFEKVNSAVTSVNYSTEIIGASTAGDQLAAGTIWYKHENAGTVVDLSIINATAAPAGYSLTSKVLKVNAANVQRWWDGIQFEFTNQVAVTPSVKYLHIAYYLPQVSTAQAGGCYVWLKARGVNATNAWGTDVAVTPKVGIWTDMVLKMDTIVGDNIAHLEFANYPANAVSYIGSIAFSNDSTPRFVNTPVVDRSFVKRDSIDQDTIEIEEYDVNAFYAASPALVNAGFRVNGDSAGVVAITDGFGVRTEGTKVNWTEFSVGKIKGGKYKMSIRYTNGYEGVTISQYNGVGGPQVMTKNINLPTNLGWENFEVKVDTLPLKTGINQVIRLRHFSWAVIDWIKFELVELDPDPSMNFIGVDYKTETIGTSALAEMLPAGTIWNRNEGQGTVVDLSIVNRTEAPAGYKLTDKVLKVDAKAITRWWDGLMFEFTKDVAVHSTRRFLHIAYYIPSKSTLDNGLVKNWLKKRGVAGNAWGNDAGVQPVVGRWTDLVLETTNITVDAFTHLEFMGFPANAVSYIGSVEFTESAKPRFENYAENYVFADYKGFKLIPNVNDPNPDAAPGTIWNRNGSAATVVNLELVPRTAAPKGYSLTDTVLKVNAEGIEAWWHGLMFRSKNPVTYNSAKRFLHVAYYVPANNTFDNFQIRNWLKLVDTKNVSAIIWNNAPNGFMPTTKGWFDAVIEVKADTIAVTDSSYAMAFNHFEFFGVPANNVSYIGSIEFTDSPLPRFTNVPTNYTLIDFRNGEKVVTSESDTLQAPGSIWFRHNGSTSAANLSIIERLDAPTGYKASSYVLKVEATTLTRWYDGLMFELPQTVTYDTAYKYLHIGYYIPSLSTFDSGIMRFWLKNKTREEWNKSAGVTPLISGWNDMVIPVTNTTSGIDTTYFTHFELYGFPANATSYIGSIIMSNSATPRFGATGNKLSSDKMLAYAYVQNSVINVKNLKNELVRVFDLTGKKVFEEQTYRSSIQIPISVRGLYIVRIGESSTKVVVE